MLGTDCAMPFERVMHTPFAVLEYRSVSELRRHGAEHERCRNFIAVALVSDFLYFHLNRSDIDVDNQPTGKFVLDPVAVVEVVPAMAVVLVPIGRNRMRWSALVIATAADRLDLKRLVVIAVVVPIRLLSTIDALLSSCSGKIPRLYRGLNRANGLAL